MKPGKPTSKWRRRDEPAWHDPHTLLTLAQHLNMSNVNQIAGAFSIETRVFQDLPLVRNYFGHRNQYTEKSALDLAVKYGITTPKRASDLLTSHARNRPRTIIEEWIDDLDIVAEFLCG